MARETILGGSAAASSTAVVAVDEFDRSLRPTRMRDGPPGLGKTTFASVLPTEMGVPLQMASGAALAAPKDLLPYLTNLEEGSVLFIDEIHRLPKAVEEFMYPAMEDFRIDIVLGEGMNARTINMPLKRFTLIGATTRSGMLSAPLRDRFVIREHLDFYTVDELAEIIRRNAVRLQSEIAPEATREIAERNRRYLETIIRVFHGGPAGMEAIAHTMNVAPDTLVDEVEPYLLRSELVIRTPRGRRVTPAAYEHLGLTVPDADGQSRLF